MKALILLLPLLALASCTQKNVTQAKLTVTSQAIIGGSNSPLTAGGLAVWGQGPDGQSFGRVLVGSDQVSLPLTNGNWTFFAMSWENATGKLSGNSRCGLTNASLTGSAVVLNLSLTQEACALTVFGNGVLSTNIPDLQLEWCGSSPNLVENSGHKCSDDDADTARKAAKGYGTSYRVRIRSFDRRPGGISFLPEVIESSCQGGDSSTTDKARSLANTLAQARLPAGDGVKTPFHITVDVFVGSTDCDVSGTLGIVRGSVPVELPHGLKTIQPRTKYVVDTSMAPAKHKLYVEVNEGDICNSRMSSTDALPFAAGLGSETRPYLICSAPQLQAIVGNANFLSEHFKLLRDIDLNPVTKGIATGGVPAWYDCIGLGGNFIPIGYTCSSSTLGTASPFLGTFDGNMKAIRGLRMRLEDRLYVGLFGRITTGEVRNLTLDRPEISGHRYVGAVAGEVIGNSTKTFRSIMVISPGIEGRELGAAPSIKVGGAFGSFSNANLNLVSVRLMKVYGEGDRTGGIAGSINAGNLTSVFASGVVNGSDVYTGGISGEISSSNLSQVRFEGYVSGSTRVGGLAGTLQSSSITGSYAHAGVNSYNPGPSIYAGGLAGDASGTTGTHRVMQSFFAGRIFHRCSTLDSTCKLGEISGGATGLASGDFNTSYFTGNGLSGLGPLALSGNISMTQAYDGTFFSSANLPGFSYIAGDLPRITQEVGTIGLPTHPCRLDGAMNPIATQITSGRGSSANPILICNPQQLQDMGITANLARHYRLASYVIGVDVPARWGTFSGSLDGDGQGIIGMKISGAATGATADAAWFTDITGTMRNLSFFGGGTISATGSGTGSTAFLATSLSGSLDKINFVDVLWRSDKSGGMIAQMINGGITNSKFSYRMEVLGGANQGGLAFTNSGLIESVENRGEIQAMSGQRLYSTGGLVSENFGTIRRIENEVRMTDNMNTTGVFSAILVSTNNGTIEDIAQEWAQFRGTSIGASGLVHFNNGTISRVFSQAQVRLSGGDPRPDITPTVLSTSGTTSDIIYTSQATIENPSGMGLGIPAFTATTCTLEKPFFKPSNTAPWDVQATPGSFGILVDDKDFYRITSAVNGGSEDQFTITTGEGCTPLVGVNERSLVYAPVSAEGTLVTQASLNNFSTFSSWNSSSIWVANMTPGSADESKVLSIYLAHLTGKPLPFAPPVWEFEPGEGLRLFNLDD